MSGALTTIKITLFSVIIGMGIGIASAILRGIGRVYIETIRNTPFIVQIFIIFSGLSSVGFRLPIIAASVFAMVVNVRAYTAEIVRAGMDSIHPSQQREWKTKLIAESGEDTLNGWLQPGHAGSKSVAPAIDCCC